VICGGDPDIKAALTESVAAVSRHIRTKLNVSETVFRSTSIPAAAEDGVEIDEPGSEEYPLPATTLVEPAHHPTEAPLRITGEQTIRNADELHKALTVCLDRGQAVVVDLSEVKVCDAASLQLIWALHHSAVQRKQPFRIQAASPAVTGTAAALGLRMEDLTAVCKAAVVNDAREMEGSNSGI
jgi:anti-anti-sigma regulatory factor